MTSLQGKNEVQVKFENSMHNYNATIVNWHHTLGCQCSFGSYAVHKVEPSNNQNVTDGWTDGNRHSNIRVGYTQPTFPLLNLKAPSGPTGTSIVIYEIWNKSFKVLKKSCAETKFT